MITCSICSIVGRTYFTSYNPIFCLQITNTLRPSDAIERHETQSSSVLATVCLLEPMLIYLQLDDWEHISTTFYSEFKHFRSRKLIWNSLLQNGNHFVQVAMRQRMARSNAFLYTYHFIKKNALKMLSANWRPFCLGLNVLSSYWFRCCNENQFG